ncbi:hypothetical protein BY458DRAFT_586753 [Sporodiniella umbellata]|nr:hypothetical protein BY458DRAFT_586753 [Sporodiniella umbellata]
MKKLPPETLYQISCYLPFKDCYTCLSVCRFWFYSFQRALYETVHIHSETQFHLFTQSLTESGRFVKSLHLHNQTTSCLEPNCAPIKITQEQLKTINCYCPQLEVFDFDPSQWKHLELTGLRPWKYMQRCAPLRHISFDVFPTIFGMGLTFLKLDLVFEPVLVPFLSKIQTLTHLVLHLKFKQNGEMNRLLSCIHQHLLWLHTLEFTYTTRSEITLSNLLKKPSLKSLTIQTPSSVWFEFIQNCYPNLEELVLYDIDPLDSKLLAPLVRHLSLRTVTLHGSHQILCESLSQELNCSSVEKLSVSMYAYQSIDILQYAPRQLQSLQLFLWEYHTPGFCPQLVSLELTFPHAIHPRYPYTAFLIDTFLEAMPQIQVLALIGAEIQVLDQSLCDLDTHSRFALRIFRLTQGRYQNQTTVQAYLDLCCPLLKQDNKS